MTTFTVTGLETFKDDDAIGFLNTVRRIATRNHPRIAGYADPVYAYEGFIRMYVKAGGVDNAQRVYNKIIEHSEAISELAYCPETTIKKYASILHWAIEIDTHV